MSAVRISLNETLNTIKGTAQNKLLINEEKKALTCCLNEADTLFNEERDRSVWGYHIHQGDPEVVALQGLGNSWTGLWSSFLQEKRQRTKLLVSQSNNYADTKVHSMASNKMSSHYTNLKAMQHDKWLFSIITHLGCPPQALQNVPLLWVFALLIH